MLAAGWGAVYNCTSTWSRLSVRTRARHVICAGRPGRMTASYYCQLTGYQSKLPLCVWKSRLRFSSLLETHTPFVTYTHTHTHRLAHAQSVLPKPITVTSHGDKESFHF